MAIRYAKDSADLAQNIYSRSGVYLLIGVLIAFSGVVFFYLRTAGAKSSPILLDHILELAPNFGILFFIEFIAFFFLRQYRAALDEYRYYEAIKRQREKIRLLLGLVDQANPKPDVFDVLYRFDAQPPIGKLSAGETTEILEARKLQKEEAEIIEHLIDLIGKLRK